MNVNNVVSGRTDKGRGRGVRETITEEEGAGGGDFWKDTFYIR